MGRNIKLNVTINWNRFDTILSDWFDVADWLKQENEAGRAVIIHNWEYV